MKTLKAIARIAELGLEMYIGWLAYSVNHSILAGLGAIVALTLTNSLLVVCTSKIDMTSMPSMEEMSEKLKAADDVVLPYMLCIEIAVVYFMTA